MTDEDALLTLTYTPRDGPRRRIKFSPRSDGGYVREEYERDAESGWRLLGSEHVESVDVERGDRDDRDGIAGRVVLP